jgi:uncharacterized protein
MFSVEKTRFAVPGGGEVSALLQSPEKPWMAMALAHGAGAGMAHPFMASLAAKLAESGIATLRYQFPYMETRRRRPDPPAILESTVAAAVQASAAAFPSLPQLAGGKSMGGRMSSQAAASAKLPAARALVFFGFPLHPPKAPATKRADHLAKVQIPMLFLQGTRDDLADLTLLRPICEKLEEYATLHIIDSADHSFHVLKRSGKTDAQVLEELAQTTASWAKQILKLTASS